jgi:glycosyltransferase involved in cell wall biosynthesis
VEKRVTGAQTVGGTPVGDDAGVRILLLVPYCGGSHRAWAEGYTAHSSHDVTLLGLPARFWKWRMQGASVTLAEKASTLDSRPDLILASDMLNLPAFLALTRDFLAEVPVALYCHENQLTYPLPEGETRDLTYAMINWLSMLAADRVLFNSRFHRDDWFGALPNMLKHFPDYGHLHRVAGVQDRSTVLPVGIDLQRLDDESVEERSGGPPVILWNQRWEYDKAPRVFFQALDALVGDGIDFRVVVMGRSHRQSAPEFEAARERLGERVAHFGYATDGAYPALLRHSDVVVSTGIHEFFGIAILEAIYSGCFPVLPDRLSYPELIPKPYPDTCLYVDFDGLLTRLRWALTNTDAARAVAIELRSSVARFDWRTMAPVYDRMFSRIAASSGDVSIDRSNSGALSH